MLSDCQPGSQVIGSVASERKTLKITWSISLSGHPNPQGRPEKSSKTHDVMFESLNLLLTSTPLWQPINPFVDIIITFQKNAHHPVYSYTEHRPRMSNKYTNSDLSHSASDGEFRPLTSKNWLIAPSSGGRTPTINDRLQNAKLPSNE